MLVALACFAALLFASNDSSQVTEEQLQSVLHDLDAHEWNVRSKAVTSLIAMVNEDKFSQDEQWSRIVSRLIELAKTGQESGQDTVCMWLRTVALKNPTACQAAVPLLVELLDKDDRDKLCCEVTLTLAAIGPDAEAAIPKLRSLCNPAHPFTAPRAAAALATIQPGNDEGVRLLKGWLRDERPEMRRCAAFGLVMCAPHAKSAAPALRVALKDENAGVRVMAAAALWKVDPVPSEVVPVLAHALSEPDEWIFVRPRDISEWTPGHRMMAAYYLGRIGAKAEPAVPALAAALKDEDATYRWVATKALGQIGKPAEAYLKSALDDEFAEVRDAAQKALEKLSSSEEPPR